MKSWAPAKGLADQARSSALRAEAAAMDRMLAAFGRLRDRRHMTPDEVLIFLAIGRLGVSASSLGVAVHPVTCLDVSKLLKIPAETVRRKAGRLVEAELLARTARGLLVRNIEEWKRNVELFSEGNCT